MRVDVTQTVMAAVQAETGKSVASARPAHRRINPEAVKRDTPQKVERPTQASQRPEPPSLPEASKLSVLLDDRQNVIYRFLDPDDGKVLRQVPPEEILRIMRNIQDMLQESEQKLNVSE